MIRRVALCLVVVLFVLTATPSSVLAARPVGAIAISLQDFSWGFSVDDPDTTTASRNAVTACNNASGRSDCIVAIVFSPSRCGSVVADSTGQWRWGVGQTEAEATGNAINALPGGNVLKTVCNTAVADTTAPTPAPFVPEPIHISTYRDVTKQTAPVVIYKESTESKSDRTYAECISFRNIADRPIVAVRFEFRMLDDFRGTVESFTGSLDGTFTQGINIDDKCFSGALWAVSRIRQMRSVEVRVTAVRFDNDAIWEPGKSFTKTFSTAGSRLDAPVQISGNTVTPAPAPSPGVIAAVTPVPAPAVPTPAPSPTAIGIAGATGGGGTLGGTSAVFGAIAMQARTHFVGIAYDESNPDTAVYNALARCNQKTSGVADCQIIVKFSGPNERCAVVAVDGDKYGYGKGADQNATVETALANLRSNGGNIGNNIVANQCNAR